jgi:hypothetical protein
MVRIDVLNGLVSCAIVAQTISNAVDHRDSSFPAAYGESARRTDATVLDYDARRVLGRRP